MRNVFTRHTLALWRRELGCLGCFSLKVAVLQSLVRGESLVRVATAGLAGDSVDIKPFTDKTFYNL